jgi:hypothetical protein
MSWVITGSEKVTQDPYLYTNTVLLLKGDGTNGSTTILDSSKVAGGPKTVAAVGNAQISTAQSAFPGGASIALDGTGDYLSVPVNSDLSFGTGNFTIELWLYIAANSSQDVDLNRGAEIVTSANGATNFTIFGIRGNSSTTGTGLALVNRVSNIDSSVTYTGTIAQATWHHVAFVRSGTTTSIYFNGTSVASGTLANQTINQVNPTRIGGLDLSGYNHFLNGYIDDLRITKGIARYTANFTPPTAPFPDI